MSRSGRPMAGHSLGGRARRLRADLDAHRSLAAAGDPLARGAGLAAAHQALALAVLKPRSAADRQLRRAALDVAVPALADAGLAHIGALVAAALIHDDPRPTSVASPEGLQ